MVGIVEERTSETYKVNVFSGAPALLNRLAFEGATKRNKPEMKRGDVVYVCLCVCVCVCVFLPPSRCPYTNPLFPLLSLSPPPPPADTAVCPA